MFATTTPKSSPVVWQGVTQDGYTLRLSRSGLAKIASNLKQTGLHHLVQNNLNANREAAVVRAIAQIVSNATRSSSDQKTQAFTAVGKTKTYKIVTQPIGYQQSAILFVRSHSTQEFEYEGEFESEYEYMDRGQAMYRRNFEQESPFLEGEYMINPFKKIFKRNKKEQNRQSVERPGADTAPEVVPPSSRLVSEMQHQMLQRQQQQRQRQQRQRQQRQQHQQHRQEQRQHLQQQQQRQQQLQYERQRRQRLQQQRQQRQQQRQHPQHQQQHQQQPARRPMGPRLPVRVNGRVLQR